MTKQCSNDRWRKTDELFDRALDMAPEEWAEFLEDNCDGDESLRRSVSELLIADVKSHQFLDNKAGEIAAQALVKALREVGDGDLDLPDRAGERVGAWRVVRPVGRGGMSGVYLAERADGGFAQTAVVKFLRRGLDTDDFVRRFVAERQILSSLHHPNIASLIDGGTTQDGLPYLVLEYVDGLPITEYCDERQCRVAERLRLFLDVARAVQYAHSNLVVHRDIKPSNILVTSDGVAKLLDFGIAKLLSPDGDPLAESMTRTGMRPLTPAYASPEQVSGAPIATASDVYQLGGLLYRLLTGERPYAVGGSDSQLREAIAEKHPTLPSVAARRLDDAATARKGETPARLGRRLRGDLDIIVLKALRKEPERRYGSAIEMAEDVRRHLEGHPILARRESRLYRTSKFLRRNRWAASVAAVLVVLLGFYVGTVVRHGEQLELERNAARAEAERADAAQRFLVGVFESADPFATVPESRRDIRVSEVMEEAARRARSEFSNRPELRSAMLGTIGGVFVGLGDPARAIELRREAYETVRDARGEDSPEAILALGGLVEPTLQLDRRTAGWSDSASLIGLQALGAARERLGLLHPDALRAQVTFARSLMFSRSGYMAAEPLLRHAVSSMRDNEAIRQPETAEAMLTLARVIGGTAEGDRVEAEGLARDAIGLLESGLGQDHARVWTARLWLASIMENRVEAVGVSAEAGARLDSLLGRHHELSIRARSSLGIKLREVGRYTEAAAAFKDVADRRAQRDGREGFWYEGALRAHADAARVGGDHLSAILAYDELIDRADTTEATSYRLSRATSLADSGQPEEALREMQQIRTSQPDLAPAWKAAADCVSGRAYVALGRSSDAARAFDSAAVLLAAAEYEPSIWHPCGSIPPLAD